jgi:hypothetical protein
MSSGFRDKLYWRLVDGHWAFHCFKKNRSRGFVALCGRAELRRSGGQGIARPEAWQRCGLCDGIEMRRRGWSESGPKTK